MEDNNKEELHNEGQYNFISVKLFANEIVKRIGIENLYTDNQNNTYVDAPSLTRLDKVDSVIKFAKEYLSSIGESDVIYVIEDKLIDSNSHGLYVNKNNINYIKINGNLNECWKRFAKLKEVCSMYVGHYDKNSSMKKYNNYLDSIKNAFDEKKKLLKNANIDEGDYDSETFAILLAAELMIPIHKRNEIELHIEKIGINHITLNDIAKSLLMPEFILKLYIDNGLLYKEPKYDDFNS